MGGTNEGADMTTALTEMLGVLKVAVSGGYGARGDAPTLSISQRTPSELYVTQATITFANAVHKKPIMIESVNDLITALQEITH